MAGQTARGSAEDTPICDGSLRWGLEEDLGYFRAPGLIEGKVTAEQAIDRSFVDAALKQIGAWKENASKESLPA
jgi:hypothetical protein